MAKYHISADGTPGICRAKEGNCPLGGSENHYNTKEEAQAVAQQQLENEYGVMGEKAESTSEDKPQVDVEAIDKKIAELKKELEEGGRPKFKVKADIRRMEAAREGRDLDQERKEEEAKRQARAKEREERTEAISKQLAEADHIPLPKGIQNFLVEKKFDKYNTDTYRGEMVEGAQTNTGTAMYGQGRYTTTNKKYAQEFGNVRETNLDELPDNPLRLKTTTDFHHLEHLVCEEAGMSRDGLYRHMDVQDLVKKMGYDGLTMGPKDDMIIVKYY